MRVENVAGLWGISSRSVYRLIKAGIIPYTTKPRDNPMDRFDVNEGLVSLVKEQANIRGVMLTPQLVKSIIQEFGGEINAKK